MYGLDFRRRAVGLVQGGKKVATVAQLLGISRITLHRWLKRKDLAPERMGPKVPHRCCPEKLAAHVEAFPDAYQHERASELEVSQPAICYGLKRLGLKKTFRYQEKDDVRRNEYLKKLESIPEEKRVYVDETGFNEPLIREYAYGKKGEHLLGELTGKRFARTSVIAGLKLNRSLAPMDFKGYCDTDVVLTWVKHWLIPELEPGDTVIWDNASVHKSQKLAEAFKVARINLLFLPPYSPDLNPVAKRTDGHLSNFGVG